jgi:hypothetical protein
MRTVGVAEILNFLKISSPVFSPLVAMKRTKLVFRNS